jgi:mono/diheme cytochrome c family protein
LGAGGEAHADAEMLFQEYCIRCHGVAGDGKGPAATTLDPRPRNFRIGKYRLLSSGNSVPFKSDIVRTIRSGMPGTAMPAWTQLSDRQIEVLADYVYGLTRQTVREQLETKKLKPALVATLITTRTVAVDKIRVPPEPTGTREDLAQGAKLFQANCAKCHGADGKGLRDPQWRTAEGFPITSRNFTANTFKGGRQGADLYTRVSTGMPGTPMPSFMSLPPADIWRLVHYVQSLGGQVKPSTAPTVAMDGPR